MNFKLKLPKRSLLYFYFGLLWAAAMVGQWLGLEKAKVNGQVVWASGFEEGFRAGQTTPQSIFYNQEVCTFSRVQVTPASKKWQTFYNCSGELVAGSELGVGG